MQTSTRLSATRQGNYLFLTGAIAGKPTVFCVDSGAGIHVLTPEAAIQRRLLATDAATRPVTGTAATVAAQQIRLEKVTLGGIPLVDTPAVAVALPPALGCDGLLGYPLFAQFVVSLDYEDPSVTLTPPESFRATAGAVSLPLKIEGNIPQTQITLDGLAAWVELDTGSSGELDLNAPFVEKSKLRERYPKRIAMPTGVGVGGVSYGEAARGELLELGPFRMTRPLLKLSRQQNGADAAERTAGRLGGEIFRRFSVTFDYSQKRLYLSPNKRLAEPFPFTKTGLLPLYESFAWKVFQVLPDSPASDEGVQAGDELLTVDGRAAYKLTLYSLQALLNRPEGTRLPLLLRAPTGRTRRVVLTLRELL